MTGTDGLVLPSLAVVAVFAALLVGWVLWLRWHPRR